MNGSFTCQVDHIAGHPNALFVFGWALHPTLRIDAAHALLRFDDGVERRIRVSIDRPREDVAAAFPTAPHAANAGYMLVAGWPGNPPVSAALAFDIADGTEATVPLSLPPLQATAQPAAVGWSYLLRRAWAHARGGRFRALWHKVRRFRERSRAMARTITEPELATAIGGRRCTVIIDHSMGGGANAFRERVIEELTAAGETVVLLTFAVSSLSLLAEIRMAGMPPRAVAIAGLDALRASLRHARLTQVIYNCGVSFPQPQGIPAFIHSLCRSTGARLSIAIHDYFLVCPSSYLLDRDGLFCGVPDVDRCRRCLPAHEDGFVTLAGERSIDRWRAAWGDLLRSADEIRCFSESSRRLVSRAYPNIAGRLQVRPHHVDSLRTVRIGTAMDGPLVIGVIGSISHHKGAGIVADLAHAIESQQAAARIVVLGHVDAACPPAVVQAVGEYERRELPDLVERYGIQLALLPSICPETFSFVAHEVLSMGLPLMTLDCGAQADLARSHPLGRVATRTDGPGLLAELRTFADDIAKQDPKPQDATA
ncbi:MAG: hypothetical protein ACKO6B_00700 [Planctomycetia bacterium]